MHGDRGFKVVSNRKKVNTRCVSVFHLLSIIGSQNAFSVTYSKYVSVNSTAFEQRASHISSL